MIKKNIAILILTLILMGIAGVQYLQTGTIYTGIQEYENSALNGDYTLELDEQLFTNKIIVNVTQNEMTNTLSNSETFTKRVPITTTSGTKLLHINYDSNMNTDFSDLIVVSITGTPLSQSFESITNGDSCELWTFFPSHGTYYLVYGNSGLSIKDDTVAIPYTTQSSGFTSISLVDPDEDTYEWKLVNTWTFTPENANQRLKPTKIDFKPRYAGSTTTCYLNYRITIQYGSGAETTVKTGTVHLWDDYRYIYPSWDIDAGAAGETATVRFYGCEIFKSIYFDKFFTYCERIDLINVNQPEENPSSEIPISIIINAQSITENFEKETKSLTFNCTEPVNSIIFETTSQNYNYDIDAFYGDDYSIYANVVTENMEDMSLGVNLGTDGLENVEAIISTPFGNETVALNDSGNGVWGTVLPYDGLYGSYKIEEYIVNENVHLDSGILFQVTSNDGVEVEVVSTSTDDAIIPTSTNEKETEIIETEEDNRIVYIGIVGLVVILLLIYYFQER